MRSGAACGLALLVLCGASTAILAQEDDTESAGQAAAEVAPGDYQQALAPYGAWVDDGSYGHVWQPPVGEEWQPYVDGSWAWTGDGWTWESNEPWGWTLHYGRWVSSPVFGWVWVPGDVWGPAWVDWFWGDGFVGWAPLSPFGGVVVNDFIFVNEANFCDPNLKRAVLDATHGARPVMDDPGAHHRPPTLGQIARVTHHPVPLEGRPLQTLAPWERRGESPRPRFADVRQPGVPPSGSAMAPRALGTSSTELGLRGVATPGTLRLGRPVLGRLSPPPPSAVPILGPRRSPLGAPARVWRRPRAPAVVVAHSGGSFEPAGARSRARSQQQHPARLGGARRP